MQVGKVTASIYVRMCRVRSNENPSSHQMNIVVTYVNYQNKSNIIQHGLA